MGRIQKQVTTLTGVASDVKEHASECQAIKALPPASSHLPEKENHSAVKEIKINSMRKVQYHLHSNNDNRFLTETKAFRYVDKDCDTSFGKQTKCEWENVI